MIYKIPVYKPSLKGKEKEYVNACLDSTWISSKGEFISKFETNFSKFIGAKYSTTVSNGTVALHVALLSLGIKSGDEVIVPSLTYIASVNAIAYCGAKPVFVDSDKDTWQMMPEDVEKKITEKTKAIMVVHLYGNAVDMEKINYIAKKYKLYVIEDCAEAFGTLYKNKHVGTFGDVSTFSFFGNKTITCGEGGMVSTNNEDIYKKAFKIKGQGLAEGKEYWHDIIGYNYRMTNICAGIGLAQLERADELIDKKINIAKKYIELLKNLPLRFQIPTKETKHTYWMFSILVQNSEERDTLREFLRKEGIETRPVFYPISQMPMYKISDPLPNAEDISQRGINLPSYPDLTEEEINYIVEKIKLFYEKHI